MTGRVLKFATFAGLLVLSLPDTGLAETTYSNSESSIGYPTVDAALRDLRANPRIRFRDFQGWTIADDRETNTVWSFTYETHPAHPAAVRRQTVEENGIISIKMDVLCQAQKLPCDKLVAQFEALNRQVRSHLQQETQLRTELQQRYASESAQFQPSDAQQAAAAETRKRYLGLIDSQRFGDAYDMNTPSLKTQIDRERFAALQQNVFDRFGDVLGRSDLVTRWLDSPAGAGTPGVYVVYIMRCGFNGVRDCAEVLTLREESDGSFLVVRHERNIGAR